MNLKLSLEALSIDEDPKERHLVRKIEISLMRKLTVALSV